MLTYILDISLPCLTFGSLIFVHISVDIFMYIKFKPFFLSRGQSNLLFNLRTWNVMFKDKTSKERFKNLLRHYDSHSLYYNT